MARGLAGDSGSSFIELALMLPLFSLLLAGAAEFGRLAYDAVEVSNAAYAGAAYGAQNHATASNTANIAQAAANDGSNVPGMTTTSSISCVCSNGTAITCANAAANCVSPARIFEYVQVNTTATINPLIHYPGSPATFTLSGQSILRVEQ